MTKFSARLIRGFLVVYALCGTATAQTLTTGMLSGTVRDASTAVLPGSSVTVTNLDTNLKRQVVADSAGRFQVPALEPGRYRMTATHAGFAPGQLEPVVVALGETVSVDVILEIGSFAQQITVTAQVPAVDVRRTDPSAVIRAQQIASLPLNGRNFVGLSLLTAGAVEDRTPQQGVSRNSGVSFHGQRARSNSIMIDGLDDNGMATGSIRGILSQEAIQEFQVFPAAYSAEFGQASGGTINIVTAGGTNRLSGKAFVFGRSSALNAREYFERFDSAGNPLHSAKAPFHQAQGGATFGGPLPGGRTFFFASYEGRDAAPSKFVTIDPTTTALLNSKGWPVAAGHVAFQDDAHQVLAKVQHQWDDGDNLTLRANYSNNTNENIEDWGGLVARSAGIVDLRHDWAVAATHKNVISHWLVDLRGQASSQLIENRSLDPTCQGACVGNFSGGPLVEIVGRATAGRHRITPNPAQEDLLQGKGSVTFVGSRHLFKTGAEVNRSTLTSSLPLHFGGRYIFASLPAIPALGLSAPVSSSEAFALGLPAAYIQGFGNPDYKEHYATVAGFVQDEWQTGDRLLVKLGMRYQQQLLPQTVFQTNGLTAPFSAPSPAAVAPRVAFSFDPHGSGTTSVHGAYGMFFEQALGAVVAVPSIVDGHGGVRTFVARFPASIGAWLTPTHTLPEPASYPSLQFALDPDLKTPVAQHVSIGVDRVIGNGLSLGVGFNYVRGKNQIGTIDFNPITPSLGAGRRPLDLQGQAGTSASVLQYTSFGETWYRGLDVTLTRVFANRYGFTMAYTLSKAEDNSADFQSAFLPQDNGRGRLGPDDTGLPVGFDPTLEKGAALGDRRHRVAASGSLLLPRSFEFSAIMNVGSGLPFNVLAGSDLNGDGDGGAAPQDRARRDPTSASSSVARNSGRLPFTSGVDVRLTRRFKTKNNVGIEPVLEVFNLFNKTNFIAINNLFGTGAYPDHPLSTYGQFTAAAPPRQVQLGVRVTY